MLNIKDAPVAASCGRDLRWWIDDMMDTCIYIFNFPIVIHLSTSVAWSLLGHLYICYAALWLGWTATLIVTECTSWADNCTDDALHSTLDRIVRVFI